MVGRFTLTARTCAGGSEGKLTFAFEVPVNGWIGEAKTQTNRYKFLVPDPMILTLVYDLANGWSYMVTKEK